MTVWKNADEAAYKFPKPKTLEELLEDAHRLFKNDDQNYAFKAGFFYGLIQLLEIELTLLRIKNESLDCRAQQPSKGNKGGD